MNYERENTSILIDMLGEEKVSGLDRFDRAQLADLLSVCKQSKSLSEAGRILLNVSRNSKKTSNDADRLRKYLSRFDISWADLH